MLKVLFYFSFNNCCLSDCKLKSKKSSFGSKLIKVINKYRYKYIYVYDFYFINSYSFTIIGIIYNFNV